LGFASSVVEINPKWVAELDSVVSDKIGFWQVGLSLRARPH